MRWPPNLEVTITITIYGGEAKASQTWPSSILAWWTPQPPCRQGRRSSPAASIWRSRSSQSWQPQYQMQPLRITKIVQICRFICKHNLNQFPKLFLFCCPRCWKVSIPDPASPERVEWRALYLCIKSVHLFNNFTIPILISIFCHLWNVQIQYSRQKGTLQP